MMNDDSKIMSLVNNDITWCVYPDTWQDYPERFITFGNDLKLYLVESIKETNYMFGGIQLSELNFSNILASKSDIRHVKAMACSNSLLSSESNDVLFAVGYTNGKISLSSFDTSTQCLDLIGKEFSPKIPRQCNTLDFNRMDNHLLASGFDKARNDSSVMVWDLAHSGVNFPVEGFTPYGSNMLGINKPLCDFGSNELVHSLKWHENRSIICGMNNKHIKMYDLRDLNKQKGASTKGVYGITLDPHSSFRFASFCENFIYLWDIRSIENPLITIGPELSSIVKIEWCPTRSNILAALLKDTNSIKLYDYKDYKNLSDEPEPSIINREISPFEVSSPQIISSFSWHPKHESQMTVISSSGIIRNFKVVDRITLNWSPISELIWTHGKKILQCIDSRDRLYQNIDDIAVLMRKLAIDGYGLSRDKLWQLFKKNSPLYYVWKWMSIRIKPNYDLFGADNPERLFGIISVLFEESRSQLLHTSEVVTPVSEYLLNRMIYTSPSRAKAMHQCGWSSRASYSGAEYDLSAIDAGLSNIEINDSFSSKTTTFDDSMPCLHFIKSNENENNFSRLAAVMVFNGKILRAIECLKRASDHESSSKLAGSEQRDSSISLNAVALTLSAYVASAHQLENNSYWFDMCASLKPKFRDPYIKAIFTFLSMKSFDDTCYSDIINDENLDTSDRVAFACMYLSDNALVQYLLKLKNRLFERADLSAILLTGVTEDGLELFSKYVENTCDVQTISLILLWSLPSSICKQPRAKAWIENYKQLLDCWRLWNVRAQFDIKWYSGLNHLEEPKQRIYSACNYCRLPVASYISNDSSAVKAQMTYQQQMSHHQYNRVSTTNPSTSNYRTCSCTNCGKTLPRCSLCLTQLGTPAGRYWRPGLIFSKNDRKLSPFSSWFTWCQTCRHGGHAGHLLGWFSENTLCPVAGCKCKCMSMDANARPTAVLNI